MSRSAQYHARMDNQDEIQTMRPVAATTLWPPARRNYRNVDEYETQNMRPVAPTTRRAPAHHNQRNVDECEMQNMRPVAPNTMWAPVDPHQRNDDDLEIQAIRPAAAGPSTVPEPAASSEPDRPNARLSTGPFPDPVVQLLRSLWMDGWAAVLFFLTFLSFQGVSIIAFRDFSYIGGFDEEDLIHPRQKTALGLHAVLLFMFCILIAVGLASIYVCLARFCTQKFIIVTHAFHVALGFSISTFMLTRKYWSGGSVFLGFTLLGSCFFIMWHPRMDFSCEMLRYSKRSSREYGHVHALSAISGCVAVVLGAWYILVLVSLLAVRQAASAADIAAARDLPSRKVNTAMIWFLSIAAYWIFEWLKNTMYMTVCGMTESWFYNSTGSPIGDTCRAFMISFKCGFSSISLGSFTMIILNFLRYACSIAIQRDSATRTAGQEILYRNLQCLVKLVNGLHGWGGRYAFRDVYHHGTRYWRATRSTWSSLKDSGIYMAVNELVIGPALTMGAVTIGYACALFAYIYLIKTKPTYNGGGEYTDIVVAIAFVIGFQITNVLTTPIASGVDAMLVLAASEPSLLMAHHAEIYSEIIARYPGFQLSALASRTNASRDS